MLSEDSKRLLGEFLIAIADKERECDGIKDELSISSVCDPELLFMRLDSGNSGFLRSSDIFRLTTNLGLKTTETHCRGIIRFYDSDNDCRLKFSEFLDLILPKDDDKRTLILEKHKNVISYNIETDGGLKRLLETEIQMVKLMENYKNRLENLADFNIIRAYGEIKRNFEILGQNALTDFFRDIGIEISSRDIGSIIARIDRDKDGKIGYSEFLGLFSNFNENLRKETPIKQHQSHIKNVYTPTKSNISVLNESSLKQESTPYKPTYSSTPLKTLQKDKNYSAISNSKSKRSSSKTPLKQHVRFDNSVNLAPFRKSENLARSDVNISNILPIFDPENKGYITLKDLELGLSQLGVDISQ